MSEKCHSDHAVQQNGRYSITSSARASSGRRHVEAERLRGLEIYHEFDIWSAPAPASRRLFALEDAIDITGRAPVLVGEIGPIRDQAAGGDEGASV